MNKRITELYDRAIVIEDGGDYVCGELDPMKFAELIVKDSIDVLIDYLEEIDKEQKTPSFIGVTTTICRIKEHFGVE